LLLVLPIIVVTQIMLKRLCCILFWILYFYGSLVKHNKIRIKTDKKRDEVTSVLLKFFEKIETKPMGMKGFMVMDDLQDSQESIVITFWETKEDMDLFYKPDSNVLGDLVEKLKPSFEHSPERKDYEIAKFKVW
jgi:heme-degrading monooxygenase HmoA